MLDPGWSRRPGIAVKQDGSVVAWGSDSAGRCKVPSPNSGFIALAAGASHSLAIRGPVLVQTAFRRGDADGDGRLSTSDAVFVLSRLFLGGMSPACLESANANDDAFLNVTDAIHVLNYLFRGGPAPPDPGPETCGVDPPGSPSDFGCENYTSC